MKTEMVEPNTDLMKTELVEPDTNLNAAGSWTSNLTTCGEDVAGEWCSKWDSDWSRITK
jgi:hypothetical protein